MRILIQVFVSTYKFLELYLPISLKKIVKDAILSSKLEGTMYLINFNLFCVLIKCFFSGFSVFVEMLIYGTNQNINV